MILAQGARGPGFNSQNSPMACLSGSAPQARRRSPFTASASERPRGRCLAETRDRVGELQIFSLTPSQLSYRGSFWHPPGNCISPEAKEALPLQIRSAPARTWHELRASNLFPNSRKQNARGQADCLLAIGMARYLQAHVLPNSNLDARPKPSDLGPSPCFGNIDMHVVTSSRIRVFPYCLYLPIRQFT